MTFCVSEKRNPFYLESHDHIHVSITTTIKGLLENDIWEHGMSVINLSGNCDHSVECETHGKFTLYLWYFRDCPLIYVVRI